MQNEFKKHVECRRAFTLVELTIVTAIAAIFSTALIGMMYSSYTNWKLSSGRSTLLQDGRAVLEQMTRVIRQAKGFESVSLPSDLAGQITFTDVDGATQQFKLNTLTGEIEFGPPDSLSALTGMAESLVFTCYDVNANILSDTAEVRNIKTVSIAATLDDPANSLQFTLSDRVFIYQDLPAIVINEIMYNPTGQKSDSDLEWVELYNYGEYAVDVNGWIIWTGAPKNSDSLMPDSQFGNGSAVIPAGGYAVITATNTAVYSELITNGDFENHDISSWTRHSSWTRTSGDSHSPSHKLESTAAGDSWVYQNIAVPPGYNSCLFLFWEKTTAPAAQTQITVTIRDMSSQILATGYSGQMSSNWTCHTMDITAFAGQNVKIYFSINKTTGDGALFLDDVSAAASYVSINAVRLGVDDDKIGNGIANDSDTIAVLISDSTADRVTFVNSWGGNGDGTSLSRIDPLGSSNQQSNWTSGPQNGTPGSVN